MSRKAEALHLIGERVLKLAEKDSPVSPEVRGAARSVASAIASVAPGKYPRSLLGEVRKLLSALHKDVRRGAVVAARYGLWASHAKHPELVWMLRAELEVRRIEDAVVVVWPRLWDSR